VRVGWHCRKYSLRGSIVDTAACGAVDDNASLRHSIVDNAGLWNGIVDNTALDYQFGLPHWPVFLPCLRLLFGPYCVWASVLGLGIPVRSERNRARGRAILGEPHMRPCVLKGDRARTHALLREPHAPVRS
jgi:hypothetical protein